MSSLKLYINIKNLRLKAILGTYDWEKENKRDIIINARIGVKNLDSTKTDNLNDTIDYDIIIDKITNYVSNSSINLIEKMVGDIIDIIMEDNRILNCKIEIDKIGVKDNVDSFSVELYKEK